ncbi:HAD-IA family hydrolase [Bacillus sp. DTU_2020_1000418_1_SI_GHA_SEK_038]|uniref:HAD-IA family hydrolase n=1 Tax=Bacillus sp. DTU_2020_1000418_1_SI_GHA_SEK_038 TaxID=3077585 RepID=UPI0028EAD246|nr:HAD-IA family hydrolase [Bacillus sp. DTU_2020_1000418_1_SI_GHA_SEK_038]WNS74701.1 HAD-IA family hydrolase [Bacillus sp. DTU_2020_1000418_1_SI_GHA_SEK_038]
MIKYIIFDFDGTIANSQYAFVSAWNHLAEKHRFKKLEHESLEDLKKLTIKERSRVLNFPMYKLPILMPELYTAYRQSILDVTLFEGMKELLSELEIRGYHTAIISSNTEDNIREFLNRNGIKVTDILCSSRIFGKDKVIKKFLKSHNLQPSEVIYVGDEHRDIVACKKCNVKVIWVGWGYDGIEVVQSENPDYMIQTPDEILQIV